MARKFVVGLDLNKNELLNARIQNLSSAPSSPVAGQIYFDTTANVLYFYNGSAWIPASGSTEVIQDVIGSSIVGGTGLTATYNDGAGTTTLDLDNTNVDAGSYGGTTKIPTFTVDAQGRLTAADEVDVATTLTLTSDTSGNTTVDLLTESLHFDGGDGITTDFALSPTKGISIAVDSTVTRNSASQTLTNKTVSDSLLFNDGTGSNSTIYAGGNDLTVYGHNNLYLNTNNADIVLQPDGNAKIYSEIIATQPYADTVAGNAQTAAELTASTALSTHESDTSTHGVAGSIVGTTDTQTLSNKTISGNLNLGLAGHIGASGSAIEVSPNSGYDLNLSGDDVVINPSNKAFYGSSSTAGNEIARISDIQATSSGLSWKQAVNLLAASNLALTGDAASTAVDNHNLDTANGYRILLKNQSTNTENGIYDIAVSGGNYTLTRSADANPVTELIGAAVFVMEGDVYGATSWVQTNHYSNTYDDLTWVQFSGQGTYLGSNSIALNGNVFSVDLDSDSLEITNNGLKVNYLTSYGLDNDGGLYIKNGEGLTFDGSGNLTLNTSAGYGIRKYATSIGTNSATTADVTHNFNTKDVTVTVFDNATDEEVFVDVKHYANKVTITCATTITTDQYRVVVIG